MGFKDVSDAAAVKGPTIGQARCMRDTQFPDIASIFPNAVGAGPAKSKSGKTGFFVVAEMVSSDDRLNKERARAIQGIIQSSHKLEWPYDSQK
jgi:hypothetical protein